MNIVLIGFMGTGKSAVGRALARRLEVPLLDSDAEIERRWQMTIPRLFAEHGEETFRAAETEFLRHLLSPPLSGTGGPSSSPLPCEGEGSGVRAAAPGVRADRPFILSTGGGTPLREPNGSLLRRLGPIVWLAATPETILKRVGRNLERRPMFAGHHHDPRARIEQLLSDRSRRYAELADLYINTAAFDTPEAVAGRIIAALKADRNPCPRETRRR